MRKIPLMGRRGVVRAYALVDDSDYEWLSQYSWRLLEVKYKGKVWRYAVHTKGLRPHFSMHRKVLGLSGKGRRLEADHLNGNGLDNRRSNIRAVTHAQNLQNKSANRRSTSKFRGVHWNRKDRRWRAKVRLNGKIVFERNFSSEQEAAEAAAEQRKLLLPYSVS